MRSRLEQFLSSFHINIFCSSDMLPFERAMGSAAECDMYDYY